MKASTPGLPVGEAELGREPLLELERELVLVAAGRRSASRCARRQRKSSAVLDLRDVALARRRRASPARGSPRTLNFTFAIQSAVCRSRSPPGPSFSCGCRR